MPGYIERFTRRWNANRDPALTQALEGTKQAALGRLATLTSTEPQHNFGKTITVRASRNKGPERTPAQKEQLRARALEVEKTAFDTAAYLAEAKENIDQRRASGIVKQALLVATLKKLDSELNEKTAKMQGPLIVRETKFAEDGHGIRCAHCNSNNEQPVFAAGTVSYTAAEAASDIRFTYAEGPDDAHVTTVDEPQGVIKTAELTTSDLHFMYQHPDTNDALRATEALANLYPFTQRGAAGL